MACAPETSPIRTHRVWGMLRAVVVVVGVVVCALLWAVKAPLFDVLFPVSSQHTTQVLAVVPQYSPSSLRGYDLIFVTGQRRSSLVCTRNSGSAPAVGATIRVDEMLFRLIVSYGPCRAERQSEWWFALFMLLAPPTLILPLFVWLGHAILPRKPERHHLAVDNR